LKLGSLISTLIQIHAYLIRNNGILHFSQRIPAVARTQFSKDWVRVLFYPETAV